MNFYPQRWLATLLQLRVQFDTTRPADSPLLRVAGIAAPVRCRQCHKIITQSDHAIEIAGAHQHLLTNPAGVSFTVVVYRQAQCDIAGLPTAEFSWFNGYSWQMAHCPQCHTHLGWYYSSAQFPDFYGLIAPRLKYDSP